MNNLFGFGQIRDFSQCLGENLQISILFFLFQFYIVFHFLKTFEKIRQEFTNVKYENCTFAENLKIMKNSFLK